MEFKLLVPVLLICVLAHQAHCRKCPLNCACERSEVTCQNMTSFPESIPPETIRIKITNSVLESISESAFSRLDHLLSFEISSSSITSIRTGAFRVDAGILDTGILFEGVTIGTIESRAFASMSLAAFKIHNSTIDTIKSEAFVDSQEIDEFIISHTAIGLIGSRAFNNMWDIGTFEIISSSLGILQQRAFSGINYVESFCLTGNTISVIEKSAFNALNLGGRCTFSSNTIYSLQSEALTNFQDEDASTSLTVTNNTVKMLIGPLGDVGLQGIAVESVSGNTIPCSCSVYRNPVSRAYLKDMDRNWCFDENTNKKQSLQSYGNVCAKVSGTLSSTVEPYTTDGTIGDSNDETTTTSFTQTKLVSTIGQAINPMIDIISEHASKDTFSESKIKIVRQMAMENDTESQKAVGHIYDNIDKSDKIDFNNVTEAQNIINDTNERQSIMEKTTSVATYENRNRSTNAIPAQRDSSNDLTNNRDGSKRRQGNYKEESDKRRWNSKRRTSRLTVSYQTGLDTTDTRVNDTKEVSDKPIESGTHLMPSTRATYATIQGHDSSDEVVSAASVRGTNGVSQIHLDNRGVLLMSLFVFAVTFILLC